MPTTSKIIYTKTDEAPMLATYSLLPIIETSLKRRALQLRRATFH